MGSPSLHGSSVAVSLLFAGGHIPAMIASGELLGAEAMGLVRDVGLVILALSILRRAADVWLMWMLHYAMDMMQYYSGASLP